MTLIIISCSITPLTTMTLDKIKQSLTIITIISFRIMTLLYSTLAYSRVEHMKSASLW
jgi:hypothetical protein